MAITKKTPPYSVTYRQHKLLHMLIEAGMDDRMMRLLVKHFDLVKKMINFIKMNEIDD